MNGKKRWLKIVLPVLIVLLGVAGMRVMVLSRKAPPKEVREKPGALVEVLTVTRRDHPVRVAGTGTVQPRQEVSITPQVSGRVTEMAAALVAGGRFKKGDLLFAVEDVDYRLAVDRALAALAKAEVEQATIESQARIARIEWERLKLDDGAEPNPLVLYQPQLKNAVAGVASARAALAQAELDLARTRVTAPFNCRVRSEQIDLGQYLRSASAIAVVSGTDAAEVIVPLPVEELRWLRIPGPAGGEGSPATVQLRSGGADYAWEGRLVRSLGEVDPRSRMTRVVVAVEDPYALEAPSAGGRPALEVGMFVEVALHGQTLPAVFAVPRKALREAGRVWVADGQDLLRIVPVTIARQEQNAILVDGGLQEGDRLVLTHLAGAADGMKLRPLAAGEAR